MGKKTFQGKSEAVISSLDFMPTFCELTGAELPNVKLDGESFASIFENGKFERTKPLLWSFYDALNERVVAMRKGDYKIMCRLENDSVVLPKIHNMHAGNEDLIKQAKLTDFVLYNLKDDVGESEDLSLKQPEVFKKMKASLKSEYNYLLEGSFVWERAKSKK
ncbi:hypothetical protein [Polaribacter sp. Hel1_85]|uniref:hypothetical protein n=1 Tax=Polaribacter sp. Hel1_85 TaxID=1250005 RepID=UPI000AFC64BA|nr:hypothetical protein [Polaribacter sp. Hel1_85]